MLKKLYNYGVPAFIQTGLFRFSKMGDVLSGWATLHGGIPQGSWLGPLVFLILTDDLRLQLPTYKYVDDTTISETIAKDEHSQRQSVVDELGPDLQNILRQSYDYLTIIPKLRSTYDGRLIYKTSYEQRKAFLDTIHLQNCKTV